jgi:Gpi18-like mannosyltransferase
MIKNKINKKIVLCIIGLFILRLIISLLPSYRIDIDGYIAWSYYLRDNGFEGVYQNFHIVYGPFYLYFLWLTGFIGKILSLDRGGIEFLIKFWSVLFDFLGAYIIYLISIKYKKEKYGLIAAAIYVLNPAIFMNSSIWGQFDTMSITMLLFVFYMFNTNKKMPAVIVYSIAIITKPQVVFFAPLVLILYFKDFHFRKIYFIELLKAGIMCLCTYIILTIPFEQGRGLFWLLPHTLESARDYPYATANAFNLWTLFGGQTVHDSVRFIGFSYYIWGVGLLILSLAGAIILYIRRPKSVLAFYFAPFIISLLSFMFYTGMHERYMLQAFIFIAVCTIWEKRLWIPYAVLSICSFLNVYYIYDKAKSKIFWIPRDDIFAYVVAAISLLATIYMIYYMVILIFKKDKKQLKREISA